ncbi:Hypothetical protein, putative [Bodo saltans]|uniref:Uncharacterized protein n=1 Tax=Bodo saltans TaxID=75058 RepID=A0A0S4J1D8_BODSA|nr:Hypothetical protein, putative [Bodo saltans]|eukprot:CUG81616.1 Hypothetical protein, putative [Bodo saltans]
MSTVQKGVRKGVSRIDPKVADEWFPHRQSTWPRGYLPATGVAHFLRSSGVTLQDVVETRLEIQSDRSNLIQRDFAADYGLWLKSELRELEIKAKSDSRFARALKRSTNRESLPSIESECRLWNLVDPASIEHDSSTMPPEEPSPPPKSRMMLQPLPKTEVLSSSPRLYAFRSFASLQEYAVLPIRDAATPASHVKFLTFPQLRNCLYTEFDSCSALKALSLVTGDRLVYTQEFIHALASYIRARLDELGASARIMMVQTIAQSLPRLEMVALHLTFPQLRNCLYTEFDSCSALKALSLVTGDRLVYTQEFIHALASYIRARLDELGASARIDDGTDYRPILTTFGNGRLAWFLNESRMLPARVAATQPEKPLMKRAHNFNFDDATVASSSISMAFPCESMDVAKALDTHKPAIVIAEPHTDRDYTAELRGYYSVREVMMLGQVDSPAMCSFTYPLLSWGITPGPNTYWVFNDSMQRATSRGHNLPVDPPYISQGYRRFYLDDISKCMIHHNDVPGFQNQSRCVSFRRLTPPARSTQTS